MASDPNAGGRPPERANETADSSLDIPDPHGEPTVEASFDALERQAEQLQAEKAELQDKLLRALAESQNVRRRAQQDVERERKFGIERFAKDVLSVADNLGRALSALPADLNQLDSTTRNVILGVQATERELLAVFERNGVTRIEALGTPFNAEFHQAVMEVDDPGQPAGTVVKELAPGYMIAGRLLRAAMVGISKGGPAAA